MSRNLGATAAEKRLIAKLMARSAFERLDAGGVEVVPSDDWSDVPQLDDTATLTVPAELYTKLEAASRKRHTTPSDLAARLLAKELGA